MIFKQASIEKYLPVFFKTSHPHPILTNIYSTNNCHATVFITAIVNKIECGAQISS